MALEYLCSSTRLLRNQGLTAGNIRFWKELKLSKKLSDLPDCYTIVVPLPVTRKDEPLPIVGGQVKSGGQAIRQALKEEMK